MSNVYTLTLDDISSSDNLKNKGALAGDTIVNGKLSRVFSTEEDAINSSYVLTQKDIDDSFTLQNKGALAGERIIDGKYVSSEKENIFLQFMYGFDKGGNLIENTAALLEAYVPLGEISVDFNGINFVSPDDLHGEGFKEASPEERREMLLREKERELQEEYGQFFEQAEESFASGAGKFTKALADPTSLIPLGSGYKTMAAGAGALGLGYSVTEDLATTGEVDIKKAAITTLGSATLTPALAAVGRTVVNKVATKKAESIVATAQKEINERIAQGASIDKPSVILQEAGINPAKVEAALKNTGRQLRIPASKTRAEKAVAESISKDSAVSRLYSPSLDRWLGTLSTRVRNIDVSAYSRLRKFEFNTHVNTQKAISQAEPFLKGLSELADPIKEKITYYLYNGNIKAAEGLMKARAPSLLEPYTKNIKSLIEKTGKELEQAGHSIGKIENYFPRVVKDYDGLRASLGKKEQGIIDRALNDFASKKGKLVTNLSSEDRAQVVDLVLRGYRMTTDTGKPRFVKPRTIKTILPEQMKYYASPEESLSMYLRGAVNDIEKRKFLGRYGTEDGTGLVDVEKSIGSFVEEGLNNISAQQQTELKSLLQARFIGGSESPNKINTLLRNTGYMGTIANPISALTQLGDVAVSSGLQGFRNTISSMFNTKEIKLIDLGLENIITKELGGDISKSGAALSKMLKGVGFSAVDKLGKETLLNASVKNARNLVKNPKGEKIFRGKHGDIYGNELDALVFDLKTGNVSDNVKLFAFNQLADVQPIALSEMPQTYLENPNGRILYMLKSFTLKQYDIVRRNVVQEWSKGNKKEAVKNAGLLAGYLTVANTGVGATKDILLGREVRPEDLPDRSLWALLGVFGMNKYVSERYLSRGDISGAVANTLIPATPIIKAVIKGTSEVFEEDPDFAPVLKGVPVVGPLFYNWFGGGAEKFNERLD